jgi:hypothetical protein
VCDLLKVGYCFLNSSCSIHSVLNLGLISTRFGKTNRCIFVAYSSHVIFLCIFVNQWMLQSRHEQGGCRSIRPRFLLTLTVRLYVSLSFSAPHPKPSRVQIKSAH